MNGLADLIAPESVFPRLAVGSRRQALQALTDALAPTVGLDPRATLDAVLLRERLGGTGVGEGVAVPHARIPGLQRAIAGFARLEPALSFDSFDGLPVDLVLLLLTPAERGADHLKALARASRVLKRADRRERLRAARSTPEVLSVLCERVDGEAA